MNKFTQWKILSPSLYKLFCIFHISVKKVPGNAYHSKTLHPSPCNHPISHNKLCKWSTWSETTSPQHGHTVEQRILNYYFTKYFIPILNTHLFCQWCLAFGTSFWEEIQIIFFTIKVIIVLIMCSGTKRYSTLETREAFRMVHGFSGSYKLNEVKRRN